jgi:hypothetical protein
MREILLEVFEEQARVAKYYLTSVQELVYKVSREPRFAPHRTQPEGMPRCDHCGGCTAVYRNHTNLKQRPQKEVAIAITLGLGGHYLQQCCEGLKLF